MGVPPRTAVQRRRSGRNGCKLERVRMGGLAEGPRPRTMGLDGVERMQSYETQPRSTEELLACIAESWGILNQRITPLNSAQLTAIGPDDGWSVKDHLAHL